MTAVRGGGWTERYSYDVAGDLSQAAWPGGSPGVGPRECAGTSVRRAGNVHFEHDAQGRVVSRTYRTPSGQSRTWRYGWDTEGRMVSAITPFGSRWLYRYDGLGRRVAKERLDEAGAAVAERVDFVWDGLVLVEQITGGTSVTWDYEPGSHRPITQVERVLAAPQDWVDARFYALVTDSVGMPNEMVDADGALVWRSHRTLWGAAPADLARGSDCPLRFAGQYHDRETGLFYNVNRCHDPRRGSNISTAILESQDSK